MIALSALIAVGFTSCELDEKPTSYYEKDAYFRHIIMQNGSGGYL